MENGKIMNLIIPDIPHLMDGIKYQRQTFKG